MTDAQQISARGLKWQLVPSVATIERSLENHKTPPVAARLAAQRNATLHNARSYLEPRTFDDFIRHDFVGLCHIADMEAAAQRLANAIEKQESIGISGDYDCDGNCSTALMLRFLLQSGVPSSRLFPHIPNRMAEGYGVNERAVTEMLSHQVSLLVTLDNGTLAFAPIHQAAQAGMSVIVADHHPNEDGQKLPAGALVVNPNRHDDTHAASIEGARDMAAVGVTFMLCLRTLQLLKERGYYAQHRLPEPDAGNWLPLVAIATIGDVVNVSTPINRMLVREGLTRLQTTPDPAIRQLCEVAQLSFPPDAESIAFQIAPIINSAGRLAQSTAWAYLSGFPIHAQDGPSQAYHLMLDSVQKNTERKQLETGLMQQARAQAQSWMKAHPDSGTLLVAGEGWHTGLIGIVASRLKDMYQLPVVVASINPEDGSCKCSARSIKVKDHPVDIGSVFRQLKEAGVLDKAGGHPMAAGASFKRDRLEDFRTALESALGDHARSARHASRLPVDGILDLSKLQSMPPADARHALTSWMREWQAQGPFGEGNPAPRILIPHVAVGQIDRIRQGKHARFQIMQPGPNGLTLDAFAFHIGDTPLESALEQAARPPRDPVSGKRAFASLVGSLSLRENPHGEAEPSFILEDICPPEPQRRARGGLSPISCLDGSPPYDAGLCAPLTAPSIRRA